MTLNEPACIQTLGGVLRSPRWRTDRAGRESLSAPESLTRGHEGTTSQVRVSGTERDTTTDLPACSGSWGRGCEETQPRPAAADACVDAQQVRA